MRHKVFGSHLGRPTNQAKGLYRSLVYQLFEHRRIETSLAKAKAVSPMVDKLVGLAKKNNVSARREVDKILGQSKIADKLFEQIAPRYPDRTSGFTRMVKLGPRFSDTAQRVYFELVEGIEPEMKLPENKVAKEPEAKSEKVAVVERKSTKTAQKSVRKDRKS